MTGRGGTGLSTRLAYALFGYAICVALFDTEGALLMFLVFILIALAL